MESGAGPSIRGGSWGTKRRADFAIDDGDSLANPKPQATKKSSKSKGYVAMQNRIAKQHRAHAQAADRPTKGLNTTNRVEKSSGSRGR